MDDYDEKSRERRANTIQTLATLDLGPSSPIVYSPSSDAELGVKSAQLKGEPKTIPPSLPSLRRRVLALVFISLMGIGSSFATASFSTLKPTITEFESKLRLNKSQFSLVESAVDISNLLLPLVSGLAIDVFGSSYGALATTAAIIAANAVIGAALASASYPTLLVGRLLFGLGAGSLEVVQRVMVTRWFSGTHIGAAMAVLLAVGHIGETLGLVIFLPLTKDNPLATGSWVAAGLSVVGLAAAVAYAVLTRRTSCELENRAAQSSPEAQSVQGAAKKESKCKGHPFAPRALFHFSTSFWTMALLAFLSSGVLSAWRCEATDILVKRNRISDVEAIREVAMERAISAVVGLFAGPVADSVGYLITFSVAGHSVLVMFFLLLTYTEVSSLMLMTALAMMSPLTRLATVVAVPILVPSGHLGTAFAVEASVQAAGNIIIGTLSGRIEDAQKADQVMGVEMLFLFTAVAALAVSIGWLLLDRIRYKSLVQRNHRQRHAYMVRKQQFERRAAAAHVDVTAGRKVRPIRAMCATAFFIVLNIAWILYLATLLTNPIRHGAARRKVGAGHGVESPAQRAKEHQQKQQQPHHAAIGA